MIVSKPWPGDEGPCGYLPDRDWRLEYRLAFDLSAEEYAGWMLKGWRHFGRTLFRPRCRGCDACRPIRVDVAKFRPDRSQRRAWKANAGEVRLEVVEPAAEPLQLDLYRRYHAHQTEAKQWPARDDESPDDYADSFVNNPFATREWRYWLGETLIGLGYVDPLPVGPSAITFFHDPEHRARSLGTFNVLALIDHARSLGQPHIYLGYYVADCPSMAYKARFAPNQLLFPDGTWRAFRSREV
jgi:arginine-tRNA-protein transferase